LGGGFPVGRDADHARDRERVLGRRARHDYGGNPLACAVAGAVFDVINTTRCSTA
jgi:acetylornithine/N-succinyldiaminopimelate aminotransferase